MLPNAELRRAAGLALALVATCAVFALWPRLDLAATGAFFDPVTRSFPVSADARASLLRKAIWGASIAMVLGALVLGVAARLRGGWALGLPARAWGHVVALYLLGPGLLVEALLKGHWGRARPSETAEFGGTALYTPPGLPVAQCAKNCSFVAGETAGGLALMLAMLLILAWHRHRLGPVARLAVGALAVAMPLAASAQRLAAGRHFLSDILAAILLILLVETLLALLSRAWPTAGPPRAGAVDISRDSA